MFKQFLTNNAISNDHCNWFFLTKVNPHGIVHSFSTLNLYIFQLCWVSVSLTFVYSQLNPFYSDINPRMIIGGC